MWCNAGLVIKQRDCCIPFCRGVVGVLMSGSAWRGCGGCEGVGCGSEAEEGLGCLVFRTSVGGAELMGLWIWGIGWVSGGGAFGYWCVGEGDHTEMRVCWVLQAGWYCDGFVDLGWCVEGDVEQVLGSFEGGESVQDSMLVYKSHNDLYLLCALDNGVVFHHA